MWRRGSHQVKKIVGLSATDCTMETAYMDRRRNRWKDDVSRWLIGPLWFRRLTTGVAATAVVGSMLVLSCAVLLGDVDGVRRLRAKGGYALAIRGCWLFIAVLGLVAIVGDIRSLA